MKWVPLSSKGARSKFRLDVLFKAHVFGILSQSRNTYPNTFQTSSGHKSQADKNFTFRTGTELRRNLHIP